VLRSFIFGLGVLFGFVAPQAAPDLAARVYRDGGEVYLNAELAGAFPDAAVELAEAGTIVAFEIDIIINGSASPVEARRSLRYDLGARVWVVGTGSGGDEKTVADRSTALLLAGRVWGLDLGPLSAFDRGGSVSIRARPGIIDETGGWHEAGILWGYGEPSRAFSFASGVEIPR
jgi:hypothetical protein